MAYVTGSETGIDALFSRLLTELTSNTDLANATPAQTWTQVWNQGDQYVLKGPGLAGGDNIYIGLEKINDPANTIYEIRVYGMTGYNVSAADMQGHVNVCGMERLLTSDTAMTYWLSMSGRRFTMVVKVSTYYETLHVGLFLPFLTPSEYPYPLFVGGSAGEKVGSADPLRWNDDTDAHRFWGDSSYGPSSSSSYASPQARFLPPDGIWDTLNHRDGDPRTNILFPTVHGMTLDADGPRRVWNADQTGSNDSSAGVWSYTVVAKSRECLGGGYPATPFQIVAADGLRSYGSLDGVFRVPGNGLTAESVITIDGDPALVFPNIWRQDDTDMWAMKTI